LCLPEEFHNLILTRESCAEFLMPNLRGAGLCIVLLTASLVEQQNKLVELNAKASGVELKDIDALAVGPLSVAQTVSFETVDDILMTCIMRHCTYVAASGELQTEDMHVTFDVRAVIEDIRDRVVRDRPVLLYTVSALYAVSAIDIGNQSTKLMASATYYIPLISTIRIDDKLHDKAGQRKRQT
jgi:hypothetical protein